MTGRGRISLVERELPVLLLSKERFTSSMYKIADVRRAEGRAEVVREDFSN
jgi:hypothetical protein